MDPAYRKEIDRPLCPRHGSRKDTAELLRRATENYLKRGRPNGGVHARTKNEREQTEVRLDMMERQFANT